MKSGKIATERTAQAHAKPTNHVRRREQGRINFSEAMHEPILSAQARISFCSSRLEPHSFRRESKKKWKEIDAKAMLQRFL